MSEDATVEKQVLDLREQGRHALTQYLDSTGSNKAAAVENISKLPARVKSEMLHIPEFRLFVNSFIVDALLGSLTFSKGQAKILELLLHRKLSVGISLSAVGMGDAISVEPEAEEGA